MWSGYLCEPAAPPEPKADYTGLYANAHSPSPERLRRPGLTRKHSHSTRATVTGQSLSVPLDDFTFAASRVQVNDLTDYEFSVKWEMEF